MMRLEGRAQPTRSWSISLIVLLADARRKTAASGKQLMRLKQAQMPRISYGSTRKIHQGIWSFNGTFRLLDAWREHDGNRFVFKFKLAAFTENVLAATLQSQGRERRRMIPTHIKVEVWKRDRGKCVICGEKDELHFDHDLPFSLGGSSLTTANVQLMCARHNLSK